MTGEEIYTAPVAAAAWLRAQQIRTVAVYVAAATDVEFAAFQRDADRPEAVVVGDLGRDWTFDRLNQAFRQLLNGARLVAIQKNRYWKSEAGWSLDAGPFVAALEFASGVEATVVGKPSAAFFTGAARALGVSLADIVVVGDDVTTDVAGAQATGAHGVLVKTGKFRPEALGQAGVVIDSIADLPALLGIAPAA